MMALKLSRFRRREATSGYPARHHEVVRTTRRNALRFLTLTGGITFAFWLAGLREEGWLVFASLAGALFVLALLAAAGSLLTIHRDATIHPYFERRVGGIDTFGEGHALAREFQDLDALAASLGVIPLSHYGFADDLAGEELTWHDASDGLRSFVAVLEAVKRESERVRQRDAVLADLERVAEALRKADAAGIRFCLLLRHLTVTDAQEWEVREGTAF